MNNNRNNRRRGRGNRNNQGGGNQLNRIDSRARGNAPQLLDKYKKLAQDAQHNGDRVQAEYHLQFADHYFRVIADNKARQDEARAKRAEEREQSGESGDDSEDGDYRRRNNRRGRARRDEGEAVDAEGEEGVEGEAADANADEGSEEPKRRTRKPRGEGRSDNRGEGRPTRARKPRSTKAADTDDGDAGIDSTVLPPAIGGDDASGNDGDDTLEAVS
ncbi:MAG: DUF4167 domain-containing protein [Erythrobacter sp.]